MSQSRIVPKFKALFSIANNIKAEGIVEAHREAALQQAKRLDAVANAIINRPSRSTLKKLAEELFAIRAEVLNSALHLLMRCKPALTLEQYLAIESQLKEVLSKKLQPAQNGEALESTESAQSHHQTAQNQDSQKDSDDPRKHKKTINKDEKTTPAVSSADSEKNTSKSKPLVQTTS